MNEYKDKFAPQNSQEMDHWHIPQDLEIDEKHFYEEDKESST